MQALKGTHDILPEEVYKWDYMEGVIRDVCARYGYKEITILSYFGEPGR